MGPAVVFFVSLLIITCSGAGGLRATDLRISPPIVQRGSDAALTCLYELHDTPLYSVKWYRGRHEFYRYSPTEIPRTKIFPFAGINVDLAHSNESQVMLTRVSFGLSGNFSCEVTADSPSFATSIVSNQMEISSSRVRSQQAGEGLVGSEVSAVVLLMPGHFQRSAPLLACEASIANGTLYRRSAELLLQTTGHPRIERVTSSTNLSSELLADLIFLLIFVITKQFLIAEVLDV